MESGRELAKIKPQALELTDVAIEHIERNIKMAERLVVNVLEKDIDYGRTPGTSQDGLWDPGAAKIMAAFNCYPNHEILHHQDEDNIISWTIQANIINRETQLVVGTGVGAASTKETKYKYRWVYDPQNYGYSEEEIKTFKLKDGKYRIPNPEYGELVNTLLQMAAKRAECDAVKSLPGVGSTLRKLFTGKKGEFEKEKPNWQTFWGEVSALGLSEDDVHQLLGIKSMKDWLSKGKNLNDAVKTLAQKLAKGEKPPSTQKEVSAEDVPWEESEGEKPKRDPESIKTGAELLRACFDDFNLQPDAVYAELNINLLTELTETPANAYTRIAAARE